MESLVLMGITNILREAFKIFTKNTKIFAFIALFTLSVNSVQYFTNFYSIKPLITDFIIESSKLHNTNSQDPKILTHVTKDLKIFIGLELIYFIIDTIIYLFTATATILAAALVYGEKAKDLSFQNLLSKTTKSWFRTLVTWLCTFLFCLIFVFVFAFILAVISLFVTNPSNLIFTAIPFALFATLLYIYLSVTWNMAIVISAIEKTKGIEAIGKAGEIIKGMKLKGFLTYLLLSIINVVLSYGMQSIAVKSPCVAMVKGVVIVYISSLVSMYHFAVFTVIYYICKKNHGERVELEELFRWV